MEGENDETTRVMEEAQVTGLRERTTDYARRVIRLYRSLPKETVAQTLGRQLLRSGTSVGANYREAARGRSTPEFIAKIGDSLRELDESAYWLELLAEEPTLPAARLAPLRDETNELISIFVTVLLNAKKGHYASR